MIYLLDTDTLIYMIRGLKPATRSRSRQEKARLLVQRCQATQKEGHVVGLSAITVAELIFGACQSGQYEEEMSALQKILAPFETFDWDAVKAPRHYGHIRHTLEQAGQPIGAMDLLIAAHALSLDATLVTNNQAHFRRVPDLRSEVWP